MAYTPRFEDLVLIRSMAVTEFTQMDGQIRVQGLKTPLDSESRATLAQVRAIFRFLNKIGALDKNWIAKHGGVPGSDP
jgi:hypothetical protein